MPGEAGADDGQHGLGVSPTPRLRLTSCGALGQTGGVGDRSRFGMRRARVTPGGRPQPCATGPCRSCAAAAPLPYDDWRCACSASSLIARRGGSSAPGDNALDVSETGVLRTSDRGLEGDPPAPSESVRRAAPGIGETGTSTAIEAPPSALPRPGPTAGRPGSELSAVGVLHVTLVVDVGSEPLLKVIPDLPLKPGPHPLFVACS